jgi:DNA gyrase subunit B
MEFSAQPNGTSASGHSYDEQSVVVLSGVDAIRKRPAMYIGSTGADGMHHLLFELVENAVDEFLAGHCRNILVVLHSDGSGEVTDDGRGIPVALHPRENRPTAEILLTDLHSGGKFKGDAYHLSGGVHGLGLTCVNALSERLTLQIWREGVHYSQEFRRGVPGREAREPDAISRTGTSIRFRPDREIFGEAQEFSYERICARLRELAYLNSGVTLRSEDKREGLSAEYRSTSGLVGFVESVNQNRAVINQEPIYCRGVRGQTVVEVALQWTTSYAEEIYSFVNSVRTSRGGSHIEGLTRALTAVINRHAAPGDTGGEITHSDVLEGLGVVLSVRTADPQFDSQAKSRLVSPEVAGVVESVLSDTLSGFFAEPSESARHILARVFDAQHARLAARRMGTPSRYSPQDMARSLEIYRKQFGIRSKTWHDSCRWLTDDSLLSAHVEMCAVGPQARMLDVCCGSGIVGGSFTDRVGYKVGLDITPEMRALASTRLDEVRAGSVYEMSFEDNSFDLVVTREVLHLLPQPSRPLSEILRVLRPGGQLIFGQTVPYGEADAAWMFRIFKKKQPLFCNNFLAEDLEQLLGECGFRNVEIKEYLQWEDIDLWIDTHETSALHRQEIRELYYNAPEDVREIHPFEVGTDGKIKDKWRWCIYSARKPE